MTSIAASLGQRTVGWSLGVWDSDRPGVDVIADATVEGARPGSILLLHDGDGYDPRGDRMQTAQAVPIIVDRLLGQGYRFDLSRRRMKTSRTRKLVRLGLCAP